VVELVEEEEQLSPRVVNSRDFEKTLGELTLLSPDEVRNLGLLFDSGSPAERRLALDDLLPKVGALSPQAVAQLRLALLNPDASVRWMSVQILARESDPPLLLFARLLRDDSREVRDAAEESLVAAGHPAIPLLAQVVAEEPCYSRAKVAATRALGTLEDPCGIEAVAGALTDNQDGCYDHETAFRALRQMGPPAIETLVTLLRYRLLKGEAYLALLEFDPAALKSALLPVIADPERALEDRMHFAEQAEILLGTMEIFWQLDAFYLGVAGDTSLPPEIVNTARRVWIDRHPRPFAIEALTRERVESEFSARHFIEEDEDEARREWRRRQIELDAARRADAEADRRSASSASAGSTASRPTRFRGIG